MRELFKGAVFQGCEVIKEIWYMNIVVSMTACTLAMRGCVTLHISEMLNALNRLQQDKSDIRLDTRPSFSTEGRAMPN